MTAPNILTRYRYWLQVIVVAAVTSAFVLLTDALAFRSLANITWMIGLPILVAMIANIGWDRRCFMAMALVGVSLGTAILVGLNFTSYG